MTYTEQWSSPTYTEQWSEPTYTEQWSSPTYTKRWWSKLTYTEQWSNPTYTKQWSERSDYKLSDGFFNVVAFGSANVKLTGNSDSNSIAGNKGKNTINAGAGNDKISGGLGNDILTGGKGWDVFVFDTRPNKRANVDRITDYKVKDDTFWLDNKYMKKLGLGSANKPKELKNSYFEIGSEADDKNDYLIYNKKTGYLYYDKDGSGSGQAIAISKLDKNLRLKSDDFFVI